MTCGSCHYLLIRCTFLFFWLVYAIGQNLVKCAQIWTFNKEKEIKAKINIQERKHHPQFLHKQKSTQIQMHADCIFCPCCLCSVVAFFFFFYLCKGLNVMACCQYSVLSHGKSKCICANLFSNDVENWWWNAKIIISSLLKQLQNSAVIQIK